MRSQEFWKLRDKKYELPHLGMEPIFSAHEAVLKRTRALIADADRRGPVMLSCLRDCGVQRHHL